MQTTLAFMIGIAYAMIGFVVAYVLVEDGKPMWISVFVAVIWPVALILGAFLSFYDWWKNKMKMEE